MPPLSHSWLTSQHRLGHGMHWNLLHGDCWSGVMQHQAVVLFGERSHSPNIINAAIALSVALCLNSLFALCFVLAVSCRLSSHWVRLPCDLWRQIRKETTSGWTLNGLIQHEKMRHKEQLPAWRSAQNISIAALHPAINGRSPNAWQSGNLTLHGGWGYLSDALHSFGSLCIHRNQCSTIWLMVLVEHRGWW